MTVYKLDAAERKAEALIENAGKIGAPEGQANTAIAAAIVVHALAMREIAEAIQNLASANRFR